MGGRSHCTYLRLGPQHKRSTLVDMVRACIRLTIPNCGYGGGRAIIIRRQALHAKRLPLTAMQLGASTRPDTTPQHAAEAHVLVMNVAVVSMFSICLGSVHAVSKSSSRPAQCHYPAMLLWPINRLHRISAQNPAPLSLPNLLSRSWPLLTSSSIPTRDFCYVLAVFTCALSNFDCPAAGKLDSDSYNTAQCDTQSCSAVTCCKERITCQDAGFSCTGIGTNAPDYATTKCTTETCSTSECCVGGSASSSRFDPSSCLLPLPNSNTILALFSSSDRRLCGCVANCSPKSSAPVHGYWLQ